MTAESRLHGDRFNTVYFSYGMFLGIWAVMIDPRQRFNGFQFNFIFIVSPKRRQRFLRDRDEIVSVPLWDQFTFKSETADRHPARNIPPEVCLFPHIKRYPDKCAAALRTYVRTESVYHSTTCPSYILL